MTATIHTFVPFLHLLIPVLKFTARCSLIIPLPAALKRFLCPPAFKLPIWTTYASPGLTYTSQHYSSPTLNPLLPSRLITVCLTISAPETAGAHLKAGVHLPEPVLQQLLYNLSYILEQIGSLQKKMLTPAFASPYMIINLLDLTLSGSRLPTY